MADLKLLNIEKSYSPGVKVIKNVNIHVKDKEFLVFVGPSGCGKSTLLRMIAGLEEISGGNLLLDDVKINNLEPKDRDMAMVFQNYALYPHMTVFDNMAFGLKLRNFSKQKINESVANAAKILEIENLLMRKPKDMSGGQRQRVAIGRAIVRNPKLFLFDEPLSNLDAKLRVQMRMELQKLHRDLNATIIYVTHDQTEAMTLGNRIVVLKDGVVQQQDTPINLYDNPVNKFVAGFLGTPPMNFIEGKIIDNQAALFFVSKDKKISIELPEKLLENWINKKVTLGIRAENISIFHEKSDKKFRQTAITYAIENMGNEILGYFTVGETKLIARLKPNEVLAFNQVVELVWDIDKCHFFDEETDVSIFH